MGRKGTGAAVGGSPRFMRKKGAVGGNSKGKGTSSGPNRKSLSAEQEEKLRERQKVAVKLEGKWYEAPFLTQQEVSIIKYN